MALVISVYILFLILTNILPDIGLMPSSIYSLNYLLILFLFFTQISILGVKKVKIAYCETALLTYILVRLMFDGGSFISNILHVRWFVLSVISVIVIKNIYFEHVRLKRLIILMIVVHVPLVVIKIFAGLHGEMTTGLVAHSGSFLFILLVVFLVRRGLINTKVQYVNILWILMILLLTYGSSKRSLIFILPLFFWITSKTYPFKLKTVFTYVVLGTMILYIGVRSNPTLNPERSQWGSFDIEYLAEYILWYESLDTKSEGNQTVGRIATTLRATSIVSEEYKTAIFGLGPGYLSKSFNDRGAIGDFNDEIEYGLNGYSWVLLQYGFLGVFLYLWYIYKSFIAFKTNRLNVLSASVFLALFFYAPDIVNIALIMFLSLVLKLVRRDEQKYFITYA